MSDRLKFGQRGSLAYAWCIAWTIAQVIDIDRLGAQCTIRQPDGPAITMGAFVEQLMGELGGALLQAPDDPTRLRTWSKCFSDLGKLLAHASTPALFWDHVDRLPSHSSETWLDFYESFTREPLPGSDCLRSIHDCVLLIHEYFGPEEVLCPRVIKHSRDILLYISTGESSNAHVNGLIKRAWAERVVPHMSQPVSFPFHRLSFTSNLLLYPNISLKLIKLGLVENQAAYETHRGKGTLAVFEYMYNWWTRHGVPGQSHSLKHQSSLHDRAALSGRQRVTYRMFQTA